MSYERKAWDREGVSHPRVEDCLLFLEKVTDEDVLLLDGSTILPYRCTVCGREFGETFVRELRNAVHGEESRMVPRHEWADDVRRRAGIIPADHQGEQPDLGSVYEKGVDGAGWRFHQDEVLRGEDPMPPGSESYDALKQRAEAAEQEVVRLRHWLASIRDCIGNVLEE